MRKVRSKRILRTIIMPLASTVLMGNGEFWVFECAECGDANAYEYHDYDDKAGRTEIKSCLRCHEGQYVDYRER